jgi:hypothetical protein
MFVEADVVYYHTSVLVAKVKCAWMNVATMEGQFI